MERLYTHTLFQTKHHDWYIQIFSHSLGKFNLRLKRDHLHYMPPSHKRVDVHTLLLYKQYTFDTSNFDTTLCKINSLETKRSLLQCDVVSLNEQHRIWLAMTSIQITQWLLYPFRIYQSIWEQINTIVHCQLIAERQHIFDSF